MQGISRLKYRRFFVFKCQVLLKLTNSALGMSACTSTLLLFILAVWLVWQKHNFRMFFVTQGKEKVLLRQCSCATEELVKIWGSFLPPQSPTFIGDVPLARLGETLFQYALNVCAVFLVTQEMNGRNDDYNILKKSKLLCKQ